MPICPFSAARWRAVLPETSVNVVEVTDSGVLWREELLECREAGGVGYPLFVATGWKGKTLDGKGETSIKELLANNSME